MARQPTGGIAEHRGKDGRTYRTLRFTAYGERRTMPLGPVTKREAEAELRHVLADVERGRWIAPTRVEPPSEATMPTFHEYVLGWLARNGPQLAERTKDDYAWRLDKHLLPFFGGMRLDTIKAATVKDYIAEKQGADKPLSPRSLKMTLTPLGAILEDALDSEVIDGRNAARGQGRKIIDRKPAGSYLETAAQITALLDAAGQLDAEAASNRKHVERRAALATMIFAGLRISELCALRWSDVDLASGWLHVRAAKTSAGVRKVEIRGALHDELDAAKARAKDTTGYVFPTRAGGEQDTHNIRTRVVGAAVKRASENLAAADLASLPDKLTPHSLRRTFCSVLYALGVSPPVMMAEMGHTDASLALRVYAKPMRREEKAALQALVDGPELADSGRRADSEAEAAEVQQAA
jgi:integrase